MRVFSTVAATFVAFSSFVAAVPVANNVEARSADPWGPICFVIPGQPKKPCTYWKTKRQETGTPVIIKPGPAHVSVAPIHTPKLGLPPVHIPPPRYGGLGHVSVAPPPATKVEVIPIDEPTPAPTAKLQVIPIEKRAPEPTFVTTFTVPFQIVSLTPGVTVTPFKTTIVIKPPTSEATSTQLSTMTPIRVTTITKTITPIPTFTITSAEPPPPRLETPTAIDLPSTFKPSPSPNPALTSNLNLGPLVPPTATTVVPKPTLIDIPTEGLTFSSTLNLGPVVPPTTTPAPPPTPIAIPTEGLTFSSQLTLPLVDPVTARSADPFAYRKEVIIELKPDV
ncbi:hypothetical protein QBC40DRAFT_331104 [Triangularia verruculosa]|uniref:Uncharacterized protein n=1 Tax=Triangularia verruculosa TaxID=2587418 RepID=A0AAN6XU76_9PEZI|nr:hypothetical protein QBC40DRAFT_331104 [Triangularia verruculosa]